MRGLGYKNILPCVPTPLIKTKIFIISIHALWVGHRRGKQLWHLGWKKRKNMNVENPQKTHEKTSSRVKKHLFCLFFSFVFSFCLTYYLVHNSIKEITKNCAVTPSHNKAIDAQKWEKVSLQPRHPKSPQRMRTRKSCVPWPQRRLKDTQCTQTDDRYQPRNGPSVPATNMDAGDILEQPRWKEFQNNRGTSGLDPEDQTAGKHRD